MTITVHPCPKDRLPEIIALSKQTCDDHQSRQPYVFAENNWEGFLAPAYHDAFFDANGTPVTESENLFIALSSGIFAGYILMSWWARGDVDAYHEGSIGDICVLPEFRGTGVGDALLAHAKSIADAKGWDNFTATIWYGNRYSERLFARAGFAPQSQTMRYGPQTQCRPLILTGPQTSVKDPNLIWKMWAATMAVIAVITFLNR